MRLSGWMAGIVLGLAAAGVFGVPSSAFAAPAPPADETEQKDRTLLPESEDFSNTPFTEYGEFDEEKEEAEATRFFQHGRFFGVSVGGGYEGALGNRGILWQGGFPTVDLKVHYWFDFNFSLALGLTYAPHYFVTNSERVNVTLLNMGIDLKYYVDTKNLSAAISFANPYFLIGGGSFSKSQASLTDGSVDKDDSFGISVGAGLEFPIRLKKTYFSLESKMGFVRFDDTYTSKHSSSSSKPRLEDLSGPFYTVVASILFTW